jgi:PRTRC genetic system protein A
MLDLGLTQYHFAMPGALLPAVDESKLLDYVVAANGVYARGRRPGLEVCMPVSFNLQSVRGLAEVSSYAQWGFPLVPVGFVEQMLAISKGVCVSFPREALFYLSFIEKTEGRQLAECDGWNLAMPDQHATEESVIPSAPGAGRNALIELHSHHSMRAEFSPTDDKDESQGFRVYAVIGTIFEKPMIRTRIGLFGHFFDYPASEFFELPEGLTDCVKV